MCEDLRMRKAQPGDLKRLTEIYNEAILDGRCTCDTQVFTVEERREWMDSHNDPRYPLYVCEKGGIVVGYGYISKYRSGRMALKDVAEISYYLDFSCRRMGIGTFIMGFLVEKARELAFKNLVAILLACNAGSIALLKKFGFEVWGILPKIACLRDGNDYSHVYYGRKL